MPSAKGQSIGWPTHKRTNFTNNRIIGDTVSMRRKSRQIEFGDLWSGGKTPDEVHEELGNRWLAWMYWVFTLEDAARVIGEQTPYHEERKSEVEMPAVLSVRAMLLGYAIECSLKCYWVKRGNKIVRAGKFVGIPGAGDGHDLVRLSQIVGFVANAREIDILKRLAKFIRFAGRYPIAKLPVDMAPRDVAGIGRVDVGFFSKADFRTCLSILNKIASMISGKKRRTFQPLGTLHYAVRHDLKGKALGG